MSSAPNTQHPTPNTRFGFCVPPFANPGPAFFRTPAWTELEPTLAIDAVVEAERLGYDSIWMADHLVHGHDGGILAFLGATDAPPLPGQRPHAVPLPEGEGTLAGRSAPVGPSFNLQHHPLRGYPTFNPSLRDVIDDWLIGRPDDVAARVREYEALGVSHFMLWFVDFPSLDGLRLFAEAVAPRFR